MVRIVPKGGARVGLLKKKKKQTLEEWFAKECAAREPEWRARISKAQVTSRAAGEELSRKDIEATLAKNAAEYVKSLDSELALRVVLTGPILAATTLLFAVYALKTGALGWSRGLTALAFVIAVVPLRPPFFRAWLKKYAKSHRWTLLAVTAREHWVLDGWLADRRTRVITIYKRAQSVAVPLVIVAAVVAAWKLR